MFERSAIFVTNHGNCYFNDNKPPYDQLFVIGGFKDNRELSLNPNHNFLIIFNHNGF
jgi:hypothetical protein